MAIKEYPGVKRPTHQISLSDGVQTFGLRLEDGPRSVQEIPITPTTVHFSGGGTKFGDWEPGMSHIEQRTWEGGRANDSFVDDATRYFDAKMAWTLTPGKLFPVPNWKFSNGYLGEIVENLPGDLGWQALYGSYSIISQQITTSNNWSTYDTCYLWVRRVGNPTTLTVRICADNSGDPGVAKLSDNITAADYEENVLYLVAFDLSGGSALVGTTGHIQIEGISSWDNAANHWEIGVDIDGGTGQYYTGGSYYTADFSIYYRIPTAVEDRKFQFFEYMSALYAVDQQADGGASNLYLNGDRGVATAGAATTLTDSNKSWTADAYIGAWVKIRAGTGAGQRREITDNTATVLTVANWDITPDTTSEYVIYYTDIWQDITPSSGDQIDGVVKSACVTNGQVLLAQANLVATLKMRWNAAASPPAHEFDDDVGNGDMVFTMLDATNDEQVYSSITSYSSLHRATPAAWGTNMTWNAVGTVGNTDLPIISVYQHDGKLYVWKADGRYYADPADTIKKELGDIGFVKSDNNGEATLSYGLYSYFSWGGYAIQRLYDSAGNYDLANVGPDRDDGLPDDRRGKCVKMLGTPSGIMAAIQSDGYSSVMVLPQNAFGWHEVFRGWASGSKVEDIFFEYSYRPRLWISVGGEMVYQDWPRHTFNPLKDSGITFYPEAQLISSTIDMSVSRLPKLIKEIAAAVENLSSDVEVHLDYQINQDVDSDNWIYAGIFQINPADTLPIHMGEVYQIRFRLRLVTKDESTPPIFNATVLEGFARTPVKYQWNMRLKVSSTQRDLSGISKDVDPDEFASWLKDAAMNSRRISMRSIWEQMDGKYVVVEPPSLMRTFMNNILGYWGGSVQLTVREI